MKFSIVRFDLSTKIAFNRAGKCYAIIDFKHRSVYYSNNEEGLKRYRTLKTDRLINLNFQICRDLVFGRLLLKQKGIVFFSGCLSLQEALPSAVSRLSKLKMANFVRGLCP